MVEERSVEEANRRVDYGGPGTSFKNKQHEAKHRQAGRVTCVKVMWLEEHNVAHIVPECKMLLQKIPSVETEQGCSHNKLVAL